MNSSMLEGGAAPASLSSLIKVKARVGKRRIVGAVFDARETAMRLTTRTSLALRALMCCAVNDGKIVRKHEIAQRCNVSENHLAQVINGLAHAGFLDTLRGRRGGMRLARPSGSIRVGEVARTFEGVLPLAECFAPGGQDSCPLFPACRLRAALARAVEAFYASLDELTIADLVDCNDDLAGILGLETRVTAAPACNARAA